MLGRWNRYFKYVRLLQCSSPRRGYCDTGLPLTVTTWLEDMCDLLHPKTMHICDGTIDERESIIQELVDTSVLVKMKQQTNCFVCRSDPRDVGRDESRVFTAAFSREDYIPVTDKSVKNSLLGNFMPMNQVEQAINSRFSKSMRGRKMFVVPFVLGPVTGDIKMMGIQVTDSGLIALLTSLLVRSGLEAQAEMQKALADQPGGGHHNFVKLVHAAGCEPHNPPHWPFNREKYMIINMPEKSEIWSFGSSHWDNALLVKKGAALQLASVKGKKERFLPVSMSVLCVEDTCGVKNIGVWGPPGSGRTVLASMSGKGGSCPVRIKLMSDDVCWLRINMETRRLHAINPEIGIFPLVRGVTSLRTPALNTAACSNSIVLNTGSSADDSVWWEGLDMPDKDQADMIDWRGKSWSPDGPRAAHLDGRFCNSITNLPCVDGNWESGGGVPLSAIIILTRRSCGFPLILETMSWPQGIMHAAAIRTRYHTTPLDSDEVSWEPMGARQYLGYNLGRILELWFSLCGIKNVKLPRIFLGNLFLMDHLAKEHMWPGYESNQCLISWVVKRLFCGAKSTACPIGYLPQCEDFDFPPDLRYDFGSLVFYCPDFWQCEMNKFESLLALQMPNDVPEALCKQLLDIKKRITPDPCENTCA